MLIVMCVLLYMSYQMLSKNQIKKQAKKDRIAEKYKQMKLLGKHDRVRDDAPSESAWGPRQERNCMFREDFISNSHRGPIVLIDCEWSDKMTEKELLSLTQQIMYSYAANRKADRPVRICVYGASVEHAEMITKLPGFDQWHLTVSTVTLGELGLGSRPIYLTADSEDLLDIETVTRGDILVIGGIVDRNRYKNATVNKACELGMRSAQLPIGEFMPLKSSKVLTVNHVVDILADVMGHKDWKRALDKVIPDRKRGLE